MIEDFDIAHALNRNGLGARVLVALEALGPATVKQLAAATRAKPYRIWGAIDGNYPECRGEHAVGNLRLVRRIAPGSDAFVLTPLGAEWAARTRRGLHKTGGVTRTFVPWEQVIGDRPPR